METSERRMNVRQNKSISMLGLTKVIALALVLFGVAGIGSASAETFPGVVSISQSEFVDMCKDVGGTPSRVKSRTVKCDMGGGYSSTCEFKTNTCTDTIPTSQPSEDESPVVGNSGTIAVDPSPSPSEPVVLQPIIVAPVFAAPANGTDGSMLMPLSQ